MTVPLRPPPLTPPPLTPLGVRLRELRTEKGILQKDMAAALGVSPAYLSALERGRRGAPSFALLQRIVEWSGLIWDEADNLHKLAALSHPRVTIDTSDLSPRATLLANRLAGRIASLDEASIDRLNDLLGP